MRHIQAFFFRQSDGTLLGRAIAGGLSLELTPIASSVEYIEDGDFCEVRVTELVSDERTNFGLAEVDFVRWLGDVQSEAAKAAARRPAFKGLHKPTNSPGVAKVVRSTLAVA